MRSTTPSAPAFTMGAKLADAEGGHADSDLPAPGQYHCAATAGTPPHAPAAPAFSLQGRQRKGSSKLRRMLGKLAEIGGQSGCIIHCLTLLLA